MENGFNPGERDFCFSTQDEGFRLFEGLNFGFNPGERDFCFSTSTASSTWKIVYHVSIPASGIFVFLQVLVVDLLDNL